MEKIIIDSMILRANITRLQMLDIGNKRRMFVRIPQEVTKSRPPIPLRQLLAILKLWLKDVSRTTPNMGAQ